MMVQQRPPPLLPPPLYHASPRLLPIFDSFVCHVLHRTRVSVGNASSDSPLCSSLSPHPHAVFTVFTMCVCVFVLFRRVQRVCLRFRLCARGDQYPLARLLPLPMRQRYIIEVALRSSLMKLLRKQDRPGTNLRVEKLRASYGHIRTPYTRENRVFLLPFSLSFSFFLKE